MTYSFSKDFIQTHPYLEDSQKEKETREICRVNNKKEKKFLNRGNVNNIKEPELKRTCTQGDLINQAVKKTVDKLSKKCKKNNDNLRVKAQDHIDITEVRNISTNVKKSRDTVNDTTNLLVKLTNDMREKLGTLEIQSENQATSDMVIRQKADLKHLNERVKHLQKMKQIQTEDITNYKKRQGKLLKKSKECKKNESIIKQVNDQLRKKKIISKDIKIKKSLKKLITEQKKLGNKKKVIQLEKDYNLLVQKINSKIKLFKQKSNQLQKIQSQKK